MLTFKTRILKFFLCVCICSLQIIGVKDTVKEMDRLGRFSIVFAKGDRFFDIVAFRILTPVPPPLYTHTLTHTLGNTGSVQKDESCLFRSNLISDRLDLY